MKRQNPLQKALRRIETEGKKHSICLYSASAMALWQHWGKKREAINTAIRALGGKATMAEIWAWAKQPEKEVNEC